MRRVGLLLLLPLFLVGCWGRHDWHQEVRLSIATPQSDVEAITVQAVEAQYWPLPSPNMGFMTEEASDAGFAFKIKNSG
jgi:PBP1b-binding outer membrane lipoprotein LpoB